MLGKATSVIAVVFVTTLAGIGYYNEDVTLMAPLFALMASGGVCLGCLTTEACRDRYFRTSPLLPK